MPTCRQLDIADLKDRFHYCPDTGFFTYRELPRKLFGSDSSWKEWLARYAGRRAGSIKYLSCGRRYVYLYVNRKNLSAHRVAWAIMTGSQPPPHIDHRNRDGTDNRWSNLRNGVGINHRNRGRQRNNTSGITGIGWHKRARKWQAYVREDGYQHYLGLFSDRDEAERAVIAKRQEIGFDVTHGR